MCGSGVARSWCRWRSGGARDSQLFLAYVIPVIFSTINMDFTITTSIDPPTRNSYLEWGSDNHMLLKVRCLSYTTFLVHQRCWNVCFLHECFLFMPVIWKRCPLPRILDDSECWEWQTKTATCSHQQQSGVNNLVTKHNVRSQSIYLCVLHSCRPSTRCHWIQIIPIRHNVYKVLDIDTSGGTGQYFTAVHI